VEYQTNSHCKHLIALHLILLVNYRKQLLIGDLGQFIKDSTLEISEVSDFLVEEIEIDKDHIHILMRISPKYSVSQHVRNIKQMTTSQIWRAFLHLKSSFGLKKHFGQTVILFAQLATLPLRQFENIFKNKVSFIDSSQRLKTTGFSRRCSIKTPWKNIY
jgi:putative transposase